MPGVGWVGPGEVVAGVGRAMATENVLFALRFCCVAFFCVAFLCVVIFVRCVFVC